MMLVIVLINLLGGFVASPDTSGIAYLAHIGGLVAGWL